ncbi:MAG TPA: hypothetical protein PLD62_00760 [Candidatus Cloacimonadota bacterium]|nr:hypothetical protein [Candidatus Cloacimonadota bacterium]
MKGIIVKPLHKTAWLLFFLLLFLNIINIAFKVKDDFFQRELPFRLADGKAVEISDSTLIAVLNNQEILKIDTLNVQRFKTEISESNARLIFSYSQNNKNQIEMKGALQNELSGKKQVTITYRDSLSPKEIPVNIQVKKDYSSLVSIGFNLLFLLFIFFNSYLLQKYSLHNENVLIVFFLLLVACPGNISTVLDLTIFNYFSAGLIGVLFYNFILEKISSLFKIKKLYYLSLGLIGICIFAEIFFHLSLEMVLICWSFIWLLASFIRLRKSYKSSGSIELKRLLNAFKGLFIAVGALLVVLIIAFILTLLSDGQIELNMITVQMSILIVIILLAVLVFLISVLWFFGAFTWSLLTGTALGVKIRSTMIYTIIGVVFVVFFGFLDYSLGELLQTLFGKFMGSEFIGGIPATIGLLIFFNPVRQRVERMVDSKLNTSELDFLEKTESFSDSITGESVIEGFEEYICENLLKQLPIKKVALISYSKERKAYIFHEIRGSDVKENSVVQDVHLILPENKLQRNYDALNENPQEIASFALILPILYDADHKWFLALGAKIDGSSYSKRDEEALTKLADKIKLSLKFILEYDGIIDRKIEETVKRKNEQIAALKAKIKELEATQ